MSFPWHLQRWPAAASLAAELRGVAALASDQSMLHLLASGAVPATSDAASLLAFGLAASAHGALLYAPLQQLLWLSERSGEVDDVSHAAAAAARAAAHELWFRLHASLAAPPPLAGAPLWAGDAVGRLFRPSLAASLLALRASAQRCPLLARAAALLQLRLAMRGARRGPALGSASASPSAAESDARAVVSLAQQLLRACAPRWPLSAAAADLLSAPHPQLSPLLAGGGDADDAPPSALLQPLLSSLTALLSPSAPPRGSPGDEALRGAAWAALGVSRLHILAAELTADPAQRVALKLLHLRATAEERLAPELRLRRRAAALPGAPAGERGLRRAEAMLAGAEAHVKRLELRAVPRPTPSPWTALHGEVVRFAEGLGCVPCSPVFCSLCALCRATQGRTFGGAFLRDTFQTSYSFGVLRALCCPAARDEHTLWVICN
jgi:hypothetical protein